MTAEERAKLTLDYIGALANVGVSQLIDKEEINKRLKEACAYFEKTVMK